MSVRLLLVIFAAASLLSCGGDARPEPNAVGTAAAPAEAAPTTRVAPEKVVADLYSAHAGQETPFFQTDSRERLDRYFEPGLAEMIWNDAVQSHGEVGAIDFDPLYGGQDTDITNLVVHPATTVHGETRAVVSFHNFGEPQQVTYVLVPAGDQWKIADIRYADGPTLRDLFRRE